MRSTFIGAVIAMLALAVPALSQTSLSGVPGEFMVKGGMLETSKGMTVYTFAKDTTGKSMCMGKCLQNWPAVMAPTDATQRGDWTIIMRSDGTQQWGYKGMPLYIFAKDTAPGEAKGDGVGGLWHVVKISS